MLRRISVLVVLLATSYAFAAKPSTGKAAVHNEIKNDNPGVFGSGMLGPSVQTKALVGGWSISFQAPPTLPSCSKPGPLEPCCPPPFSKQRYVLPRPAVDPVPVRGGEKAEVVNNPVHLSASIMRQPGLSRAGALRFWRVTGKPPRTRPQFAKLLTQKQGSAGGRLRAAL